jgi:hypothetical protein
MNRPLHTIETSCKGVAASCPGDIVKAELPCGFRPNACDLLRAGMIMHIDRESHHGGQGRNEEDEEEQRIL